MVATDDPSRSINYLISVGGRNMYKRFKPFLYQ